LAEKYDVVVVGGGPGGYPAAIRASQLGLNTALVEEDSLGGECTNYGCIPTKAMLKPVEHIAHALRYPFASGSITVDYASYMEWVRDIVSSVSSGVGMLLKGYGVDVYRGRGVLESSTRVRLGDDTILWADKIIIATGTSPATLPGVSVDGIVVHDNRSILGLRRKPGSMMIVGGGYIGVEYANIMSKLGVEVYMVEMMPRLLPGMDRDLARVAERRLKKGGVKLHLNTVLKELNVGESSAVAILSNGSRIEVDTVLIAVGRKPNTRGIGLESTGVMVDSRGFVRVDDRMNTSNPRIYASGDITGPPLLAHKAFLQAVIAGENAAGVESYYQPRAVPSIIYTEPELASTGYTLEEARKQGYNAVDGSNLSSGPAHSRNAFHLFRGSPLPRNF